MNPLQLMAAKAEMFDAVKLAIGRAITESQQAAASSKLAVRQTALLEWLATDAGRAAARAFADAFTTGSEVKTPTEVGDNR